ncbi:MAG UNVERIFIED_CONTAM: hypothetical protein LVR18_34120 [Planctomycetaceae bacterium]
MVSAPASGDDESSRPFHRQLRAAELRRLTISVYSFDAGVEFDAAGQQQTEQLHNCRQGFMVLVDRHVQEHGGTLLPASGEDVIACFGYPRLGRRSAACRQSCSGRSPGFGKSSQWRWAAGDRFPRIPACSVTDADYHPLR